MKSKQSAKNTEKTIWRGLAVGLVSAALMASIGSYAYGQAMSGQALYGTKIGYTDVGGLNRVELVSVIKSEASKILNTRLDVVGQAREVTLTDLGVEIDTDAVVDQLLKSGRGSNFVGQLFGNIEVLVKGRTLKWSLVANDQTEIKLNDLVASSVVDPIDAQFTVKDGLASIELEKVGTKVDVDSTLKLLADRITEEQPTSFEIKLKQAEPIVKSEDLKSSLSQVTDITNSSLDLVFGWQTFSINSDELINWLAPIKNHDGTYGLQYNEGALRSSLDKISAEINKKPVATQVSATDGSIIHQGVNGRELDMGQAIKSITESLSLRVGQVGGQEPVKLVTKTVEAPIEKIATKAVDGGTSGLYEGKYIEVDLSSQVLYQYDGNQQIAHYIVSTGKWSTPTPIGTFTINDKNPRAYSSTFGLYMPYWMAFIGSSYGFHELPEWPSGYKEGQDHLGTPVSHGCVRLGVGSAATLYSWADIGTPVVIHN